MSERHEVLRETLREALAGRAAHVPAPEVFDGLAWDAAGARPEGSQHSIFQLLNHLVFWQEFAIRWLDGDKPTTPQHAADSWPGGESPTDRGAWEHAVDRFKAGLADLSRRASESDLFARLGPKTALEILQIVASHNSYHAGQVAALRRALAAWPPPGGGATW